MASLNDPRLAQALRAYRPETGVMAQPSQPGWVPEYEQEPPLEAPMISPEDIIQGAPKLGALGVKALLGAAKGGMPALAGITAWDAVKEGGKYAKSLSGPEKRALNHYTDPDSWFHAFRINDQLRRGEPLDPGQQEYVDTLTKILRNAPRTDSPVQLHRGVPPGTVGKRDPAFMSASADRDVAVNYADAIFDDGALGDGVVQSFHIPKGSPMLNPDISNKWDESELLMPRGSMINRGSLFLPAEFR